MSKSSQLIFGIHAVIEAIRSGKEIEKILIKRDLGGNALREIIKYSRDNHIPYQFVPLEKLNKLTPKNHQGVIAFQSPIAYQNIEQIVPYLFEQGKVPIILLLDGITDVRNFGSIVRTAECAGVDAIVVPDKGSALINSDAVKTSSGALHIVPVCRTHNLKKTVQYLKDSGLTIVAATEKGSQLYTQVNFDVPIAIVMGSEEKGVSSEIIRISDYLAQIPLYGKIESLNVAVATGVILYEIARQRNKISS